MSSQFSISSGSRPEPQPACALWKCSVRQRLTDSFAPLLARKNHAKTEATSILRSVREERATQKIGQSAIGPPGWLEKGSSASLLVRYGSQRIRSSLAPSIQTLLKPTVCLPLMRRCTTDAGTKPSGHKRRSSKRRPDLFKVLTWLASVAAVMNLLWI